MSGKHAAFEAAYTQLNDAQRDAVDATEGPVMVVAGPGTGKTQILTLRIANIMRKTDLPPSAILALTFTNAAAANMRSRLVSIVGSEGYRVSIYTFHSFAHHIIEHYPEVFSERVGASAVSEVEQLDLVRSLLDQGAYPLLTPLGDRYFHVTSILRAITHLKREGIVHDQFLAWIQQERAAVANNEQAVNTTGPHKGKLKVQYQRRNATLDKDTELAHLYERYQTVLRERRKFDFDDALLMLIEALETREPFLRELQEEYQYFLVDEHQDTNGAQNRILELLATYFEEPNLFVVGDEKQAIFRFQGASLANFLHFETLFKNVRRITLTNNYRSHQGLLDASHALMSHAREGIPAPLVAQTGVPSHIDVYRLNADDEELLFVAEAVRAHLADGLAPHEVCVLVRQNRDIEPVRDYFERLGIPFIVESGHGVLDDPDIRALNMIFAALANLENDDALAKLLLIDFLGVPLSDVYTLLRRARERKVSLYAVLADVLGLESPEAVRTLARNLTAWKRSADNDGFLQCFERVVRESGFLTHIERSTFHVEKFDKLVRLFDEVKANTQRNALFSVTDYHTFLRILNEHGLTLEAKSRNVRDAVRVMTAHKAKGLEFEQVFITGAFDGHWGGRSPRTSFWLPYGDSSVPQSDDGVEDERRLFYVALTRARTGVAISYTTRGPDGRERVPAQFIEEIPERFRRTHTASDVGVENKRPPLFVARASVAEVEKYRTFVVAHFNERGLSATALNSYLVCPWQWFYNHFFHCQFVKTIHQKRGTAVHAALQAYFNERNKQGALPVERLLELLHERLLREELEPHLEARVWADTQRALSGWHAQYVHTWPQTTINELRITGVLPDGILLNGSLDKLECLDSVDPRQSHDVNVVDYKTGKPKSRNEIEGKTKARGAGQYKRQLVFYKLLLSLWRDGWYRMHEAALDFVEPNERGVYKKESFTISADEVTELTHTVRSVAHDIRTLAFWQSRCGEEGCDACALRETMKNL